MARQIKLVTSQQVLKKLHITKLRGVKNLDISFEGSAVTGIFGLNGSGKTTVLQAVVCVFRSKNESVNTKLSRFFKYTGDANRWIGSSFNAMVDYLHLSGSRRRHVQHTDKEIEYSKPGSEWKPRQAGKPDREVIYIALADSVPDIEKISDDRVSFAAAEGEVLDAKIETAASAVMGVSYTGLKISKISKLDCFTVVRNGVPCHSLNLGAGEQKVFRILQRLYRAPQYSLIVIDEIDLTLHTAALRQLIHVMVLEAKKPDRRLQIVFTSHRQELMKNAEFNVRYIINTPAKTFCLNNPSEECYEQLSGTPEKYLKIYVEDEVGAAIVNKCMKTNGMSKHFVLCKFGSITNSVRLALGLACQHDDISELDDTVFFGDGDVEAFSLDNKIKEQVNKTLSGDDQYLQDRRDKVPEIIKHFNPGLTAEGKRQHPEEFIYDVLISLDENNCQYPEIIRDAKAIAGVADHHDYVKNLLDQGHQLGDIIEQVSVSPLWSNYVSDVVSWINSRKAQHQHLP